MTSTPHNELAALKKVAVDFGGHLHFFRLVPQYTFSHLLIDAAKHWMLDADDYELQDEDGSTWPSAGVVVDVLLAEKAQEDFQQSPDLQVFLKPLDTFASPSSPTYHNPPPSLASSLASSSSSNHSAQFSSTPAISIPQSSHLTSKGLVSPHYHHQRLPSKSDAVRKLIEENRLPPAFLPSSLSSSFSIEHQSDLSTHNPSLPSPTSVPSSTAQGVPVAETVEILPTRPIASSTDSANGLTHYEPRFASPTPVISRTSSSSSSSSSTVPVQAHDSELTLPPIQHGYSRRGNTEPLSQSMGETPSSPSNRGDLKAAGIRLRKAYDNVTVNEILSDPRIQLAPTTHKDVTLEWDSPPTTVLIIKKRQEPGITELLKSMAIWLQEEKGIKVLVEPSVTTELPELQPFSIDDPSRYPDIVICLGGDGTVLHANTLFQNSMPPVMAFSLGSLGFLTPFRVRKYKQSISGVLNQCKVTLRSRLFCIVVKHVDGKEQVTRRTVLNEVVVDRGYSPYLSNLECLCDNVPITNIQADGIIVSSTTGSTAYSLSAGGSMVHPQMPAILFTPICPHSLSFRPLIFPDSVELKIQVPDDSRSTAWASFDGREQTELHRGDHLIIRVSKWPFVWIRDSDGVGDWFKSLADCLHWNDRRKQKPVAQSNPPSSESLASSSASGHM